MLNCQNKVNYFHVQVQYVKHNSSPSILDGSREDSLTKKCPSRWSMCLTGYKKNQSPSIETSNPKTNNNAQHKTRLFFVGFMIRNPIASNWNVTEGLWWRRHKCTHTHEGCLAHMVAITTTPSPWNNRLPPEHGNTQTLINESSILVTIVFRGSLIRIYDILTDTITTVINGSKRQFWLD